MNAFSCYCNCKCWGDCYAEDFMEGDICGECECHGDGLTEADKADDIDGLREMDYGESAY